MGMQALKELCRKSAEYLEKIKNVAFVKNAVTLLGGKKEKKGVEEKKGKEEGGEKKKEEEEEGEDEVRQMEVGEKIALIELLSELVKGGIDIGEEEELKEALMELEEEANEHVEDEIKGEGEGEEKEEEKREWEELSEKAHQLVWVMEKMKNRREGKKIETMKMMKKEREALIKRCLIPSLLLILGLLIFSHLSSGGITPFDSISVTFPEKDGIKQDGDAIIHHGSDSYRNCFIGGVLTSV